MVMIKFSSILVTSCDILTLLEALAPIKVSPKCINPSIEFGVYALALTREALCTVRPWAVAQPTPPTPFAASVLAFSLAVHPI
ncbi:hypothetical protein TNCV_2505631 [Trichonephila clavipes]|uniref:Secreted protein n=1 Tax=Trichonephila clavipes TaxID=2585209 RepID=A0A8X7BK78_TRICX|nr:hypothetical protein TNCV_2505631 [Trichonephila clavipes]